MKPRNNWINWVLKREKKRRKIVLLKIDGEINKERIVDQEETINELHEMVNILELKQIIRFK